MQNDLDQRHGWPKGRRRTGWLRWLCNPRTLRLLIRFGVILLAVLRAINELVKLLQS